MGMGLVVWIQADRARRYRESAMDANRKLLKIRASLLEQKLQKQGLIIRFPARITRAAAQSRSPSIGRAVGWWV